MNATAVGNTSTASGDNSAAFGTGANATGLNATAIGGSTRATADNATSVGQFAWATAAGGTAIGRDSYVYGDGVNTASRIQSSARPGQILISTEVWRVLLPLAAFSFNELGTRTLKGLSHPIGVYEVRGAHDLPRTPVRSG